MKTFIALPVWGDKYLRIFLDWALPTLVAPGNLISGPFSRDSAILFYTTQADRQVLEADPAVQRLGADWQLQWNIFEPPTSLPHRFYKHDLLSACYSDAALLARAHGAAWMPLTADNLYSAGAFSLLAKQTQDSDIALIAGLRLDVSATQSALFQQRKDGNLALSSAELLRLVQAFPHPHFLASFIDAERFTVWSSHVYTRQNAHQFVAHCYHLHPVLIRQPQPFGPVPPGSSPHMNNLDGHYLQQYFEAGARFQIIDHSDFLGVTLSEDEDVPMDAKPMSPEQRQLAIEKFGQNYCLPVHRFFYKTPIYFRC